MKLMITGANGQLGKELQRQISTGQAEYGGIPSVFHEAGVTAEDLPDFDVSALAEFRDRVRLVKPDIIINCAALTDVDSCEENPVAALRANAIGARNAAIAAAETGAKIVHVSTDYVFSGESSRPYSEWDTCAPQSVYGHTKRLGEQYVQTHCQRHFIVRTSWSYGYEGHNFVKAILKNARGKEIIKVVDDQLGNPTSVPDLALHILRVAATEEYGIYHCTGNGICSRYEFAKEIVRLSGLGCEVVPCSTDQFPRLAKRPAYSALEHHMLHCTVGDAMRPWNDALKSFMSHYNTESGEFMR